MSLSTTTRRLDYQGDNVTKIFPYTFKVFDASHLKVLRILADGTVSVLVLGTGYTVTGVGRKAGGNVTLTTALLDKETLVIAGQMPLTQTTDIRNQGEYYPQTIEDTFDKSRMMDQQLNERIDRTLRFPLSMDVTKVSPVIARPSASDKFKVMRLNATGTGFEYVDPTKAFSDAGGGATGKLQAPTDGTYGGASGNPSKVAIGDTYEDAVDKMATLFGKLVPTPPDNLSVKVLTIPGSYTGLEAGTGAVHLLTDLANPIITPGLTSNIASGFADPDAGTLGAFLDGVASGLITLTTSDDTGKTDGLLAIVAEFDPYAGQGFGKQDIFKAITARIQAAGLAVGAHQAYLIHSTTGQTAILAFYVDDPGTPVATLTSLAPAGGAAVTYRSGVPGYAAGAQLLAAVSIANAVRTHYNQTRIARVSAGQTNTVDLVPAAPPAAGATFTGTATLTLAAAQYSEDVQASAIGYNSKGTTSAAATRTAGIRTDTIGSEAARLTSGTGQFPTTGYGSAYDSTVSLASTKGLQYLNGRFQYPPLLNYSAKLPAGPDYTGLTPDTYNNMRWVTFSLGAVTNASFVLFAIQNSINFGSAALIPNVAMYVRVDGATPTAGWIDANAAYSGTGSPTNNGDGALDVGSSTAINRRVTFGSSVRTGTVFVRIGIPSGSNLAFGGIA